MSNDKSKEVLKSPAKARATHRGYLGRMMIEEGEVFEVPAGTEKQSSWFEILEELPEEEKRRDDRKDQKHTSK